ncbi:MAG: YbhB/YbcL family Raf kinase inhibitor-like protein [bacterium]|nr:YbhB/YbcL family Raf kinase inhibitor-like protein [bacterium]
MKNYKRTRSPRYVATLLKKISFLSIVLCLSSCWQDKEATKMNEQEQNVKHISVTSNVFKEGESIPSKYTCDGEDISPHISWSDIPAGTKSIALICDDPDAPMGTWVHWVVFNLPFDIKGLPQTADIEALGGIEGKNSWGDKKYGGPCPPDGEHRYYFTVYALDTMLDLDEIATKQDVLERIEAEDKRHLLAIGQLMGRYERQS